MWILLVVLNLLWAGLDVPSKLLVKPIVRISSGRYRSKGSKFSCDICEEPNAGESKCELRCVSGSKSVKEASLTCASADGPEILCTSGPHMPSTSSSSCT